MTHPVMLCSIISHIWYKAKPGGSRNFHYNLCRQLKSGRMEINMTNQKNANTLRLMDNPEDYKRLGVNPHTVEMWEDQRRDDDQPGHWEWWYFDAMLDDGTSLIIQFLTKSFLKNLNDDFGHPRISLKVTFPDGTYYDEEPEFSLDDCKYGEGKCDVSYGNNTFKGDLQNYCIHIEPYKGFGADLKLKSLANPYRPGTAYFSFGDNESEYYTRLCAVPKGEVTGTLNVNGKTIDVHGMGYHDHQWGNGSILSVWNHWTWARQSYEDYTLLLFDMVGTPNYDYKHFPIVFIQDKTGNIIFENTKGVEVSYEVMEEYHDEKTSKDCPKLSKYTFKNADCHVEYTLQSNETLHIQDGYDEAPASLKVLYDHMGLKPSYIRFLGTGTLKLTDKKGTIERSGELIYEFMYPGSSYKK